jgi:hypothetical protein
MSQRKHPHATDPSTPFPIGWQPTYPKAVQRSSRLLAGLLLLVVIGSAVGIGISIAPGQAGVFDFGNVQRIEGTLIKRPVPMLRLEGANGALGVNALLVGPFKSGLPDNFTGKNGQKVAFDGTLIYQNGVTMIEVSNPDSLEELGDGGFVPAAQELGEQTFTGELVDTKCYLSVMRPGEGRVHRACAVRCLSGGITPGLLLRDENVVGTVVFLSGPDGDALDYDVRQAGLPITVSGALERHDGVPVLKVNSWELSRSAALTSSALTNSLITAVCVP